MVKGSLGPDALSAERSCKLETFRLAGLPSIHFNTLISAHFYLPQRFLGTDAYRT